MNCLETQRRITPFIDGELDEKELEAFLIHINHCDDCKEELAVYNTLLTGMRLLDEDRSILYDFHTDLEMKIDKAEERIIRSKIMAVRRRIIILGMIIILGLFLGLEEEKMVEQDIVTYKRNEEIKSFKMRQFFKDNPNQYLNKIYFEKYQEILYDINEDKERREKPFKGEIDEEDSSN